MPRDNRAAENTLITKFEFTECRGRADDHRWIELKLPGLPVVRTHFSHTKESIGSTLWGKIAAQLKVHSPYLDGMIDCKNCRDDYYEKVKDDPYPPWPDYILKRLR